GDPGELLRFRGQSSHSDRDTDLVSLDDIPRRERAEEVDPIACVAQDDVASPWGRAADGIISRPVDVNADAQGVFQRGAISVSPDGVPFNRVVRGVHPGDFDGYPEPRDDVAPPRHCPSDSVRRRIMDEDADG